MRWGIRFYKIFQLLECGAETFATDERLQACSSRPVGDSVPVRDASSLSDLTKQLSENQKMKIQPQSSLLFLHSTPSCLTSFQ